MTRLTKQRLEAIAEALRSRLAGEFGAEFGSEYDGPDQDAYEAALDWAEAQLQKRETQTSKPGP